MSFSWEVGGTSSQNSYSPSLELNSKGEPYWFSGYRELSLRTDRKTDFSKDDF